MYAYAYRVKWQGENLKWRSAGAACRLMGMENESLNPAVGGTFSALALVLERVHDLLRSRNTALLRLRNAHLHQVNAAFSVVFALSCRHLRDRKQALSVVADVGIHFKMV